MADDVKSVVGMEDVGSDEALKKLIESLTSEQDIEGKTDLNSNQIVAISRADWYGRHYDSPAMKTIVLLICKYLQSKGRMGRTELVNTLQNIWAYRLEKAKGEQVKV